MAWLIRQLVQWAVLAGAAVQILGLAQSFHPFFDSIGHFRLHITVALAAGVVLLLLMRSRKTAMAALVALAGGVVGMAPAFGSLGSSPDVSGRDILVFQNNTLFRNETPRAIIPQVQALKPDIITLQEVSQNTSIILSELAADYPHQINCPFTEVGGVAVLSRWPVIQQGCAGEEMGFAWLQVDVEGQKVTFASLHLYWPFPFEQPVQLGRIEPMLKALPRPVVLAGDFNAAPWSHAVSRVAAGTSTHLVSGFRLTLKMAPLGLGPWPLLPIDHVLVPDDVSVLDVHIGESTGSDHLPVVARIRLGN